MRKRKWTIYGIKPTRQLKTKGEAIWFTEIKQGPVDWELFNEGKLIAAISRRDNDIVNYDDFKKWKEKITKRR